MQYIYVVKAEVSKVGADLLRWCLDRKASWIGELLSLRERIKESCDLLATEGMMPLPLVENLSVS